MRLLSILMLLCLLFSQATAEVSATAVVQNTKQHKEIQDKITAISKKYDAVGVTVAYVRGGVVADTFVYGHATRKTVKMKPDTKVRTASITKVMVGLAAHLTAEKGLMDLDAGIDQYLGFKIRLRNSKDKVTARSILTHTSSIDTPDDKVSGRYSDVKEHLTGKKAVLAYASGDIKNWSYSNYAFYVLGMAVERANNKTMDQILEEAFADKLKMDGSFWGGDLKAPEKIATIYNNDRKVTASKESQMEAHAPGPGKNGGAFAGSYRASAYDLGKVVAMLANDGCYDGERIISASVVAALEKYIPQIVPDEKFYQAQPLRYRKNMYGRQGLYYHTGSNSGEFNLIAYDPVRKDGVVVLSTGAYGRDSYGIYAVCGAIADLLFNTDWK
ncbi:MAG: beta-lactamase family protein [Clostridia bacterium]|nr:beta-lactamase family protein [Clostridia bacterium]